LFIEGIRGFTGPVDSLMRLLFRLPAPNVAGAGENISGLESELMLERGMGDEYIPMWVRGLIFRPVMDGGTHGGCKPFSWCPKDEITGLCKS
jgi:hypothetical protein